MHSTDTESIQSGFAPRVATFFALYPDPVGLDDGAYFCASMASPVRGFPSRIALHLKNGDRTIWLNPKASELFFVSVRFHRGNRQQDYIAEHMAQLNEVVGRIGGSDFPAAATDGSPKLTDEPSAPSSDSDESSSYTVVEMTTPLVEWTGSQWNPCLPDNNVMGPILTRCIDELIRIINAYRFAEKIMIPSPSRERVGPLIIAVTRTADPGQGGWDEQRYEIINYFATHRQPILIGTQSRSTMMEMTNYLTFEDIGHPSIAIMQLQADLNTAFYQEGNSRSTVMFAYTASEVLLDTALMGMLYEEGRSPEEAAIVYDKPLKTRILTEYHDRIGGSWTPKGSHPVAVWLRDLLLIRHRVAHAGYLPSSGEAEKALAAYFSLGRHLRDGLARRVKKYPITSSVLVTRGGFERRNIRTKAVDQAIETTTMKNLPSLSRGVPSCSACGPEYPS
jgi:hypothetical protein